MNSTARRVWLGMAVGWALIAVVGIVASATPLILAGAAFAFGSFLMATDHRGDAAALRRPVDPPPPAGPAT